LIYPSLYEGFGIPVIEAMKMGLPVITSNVTSLPEVAGDAAYLVDPYNIEEMTSAMSELLQNKKLREEMIEKGLERSRSYTWQNTSERYLKLYQELIASH
jgi:glycosyltransferase involved in cell wall biosynthesis